MRERARHPTSIRLRQRVTSADREEDGTIVGAIRWAIRGAIILAILGVIIGGVGGAFNGSRSGCGLEKVIDLVVISGWSISDSWAQYSDTIIKGAISNMIKGAIGGAIVGAFLGAVLRFWEPEGGDGASEDK